jgi:hypothetical protein
MVRKFVFRVPLNTAIPAFTCRRRRRLVHPSRSEASKNSEEAEGREVSERKEREERTKRGKEDSGEAASGLRCARLSVGRTEVRLSNGGRIRRLVR